MKRIRLIAATIAMLCIAQIGLTQTTASVETRVHDIARTLRCPVCQGETLDESDAAVAQDLRQVLRDRLLAGDSDAQARAYLIARYGEAISLSPDAKGANLILWGAAPFLMLVAFWGGTRRGSRRPSPGQTPPNDAPLTEEERLRLKRRLLDRD